MTTPVKDSPTDWVKRHIDRYVASGGDDGHLWRGAPTLLVTTTGRRTGQRHRTALIYGRDGANYVLVASQGGAPKHPGWYHNLTANPEVELQVGNETFPAIARTADPAERQRLWPRMVELWPDYDAYVQKTDREIPVVLVTRIT